MPVTLKGYSFDKKLDCNFDFATWTEHHDLISEPLEDSYGGLLTELLSTRKQVSWSITILRFFRVKS
jgi:hypothetical protein